MVEDERAPQGGLSFLCVLRNKFDVIGQVLRL